MVACSRGQVGGLGVDGIVDRGWVVGWGWGCAPSKAPNHPLTASKPPGQSGCNFQHTTSPERKSAEKQENPKQWQGGVPTGNVWLSHCDSVAGQSAENIDWVFHCCWVSQVVQCVVEGESVPRRLLGNPEISNQESSFLSFDDSFYCGLAALWGGRWPPDRVTPGGRKYHLYCGLCHQYWKYHLYCAFSTRATRASTPRNYLRLISMFSALYS